MRTANAIAGIARRQAPARFVRLRDVNRKLHLWLGATAVVYVVFMCLTGCVLLFEDDLYRLFSPDPPFSVTQSPRLGADELARTAFQLYPDRRVVGVWDRKVSAGMVAELWLDGRDGMRRRLFHPYTGADLGDAHPAALRALGLLRDAHENLLAGAAGRIINGAGAICLLLLSVSGTWTWFAGRYGSRGYGSADRARTMHLRVGIWASVFAAIWGLTGVLFCYPWLSRLPGPTGAETLLQWSYPLHSGSIGGLTARIVWAACSLLTTLLAITGTMMWQKRTSGNRARVAGSTRALSGTIIQSS
jgi:uncharacterized iron-regulated membrane protein